MAIIGIDVSKDKLDACWLRDQMNLKVKTRVFKNTEDGFGELLKWLLTHTEETVGRLQVMMEATGVYHEQLAYFLHEAGVVVHVVNPLHANEFAKSLGKRSKTDKKDSVVLARFLASRSHQVWTPEPEAVRQLKVMLSRLQALDKDIQRECNRREKAEIQRGAEPVLASIDKVLKALREERQRLQDEIDDHIDRHPGLKADRKRLESIPGIGPVLSAMLLAALLIRDFHSAGQAAAFHGLIPVMRQSGTSVKFRAVLSKAGCGRLRAKLYMGAVVAIQHNPQIKAHYERLLARGKTKMSALGAAMRKLLQMAYGVLKHKTDYDPQWGAN